MAPACAVCYPKILFRTKFIYLFIYSFFHPACRVAIQFQINKSFKRRKMIQNVSNIHNNGNKYFNHVFHLITHFILVFLFSYVYTYNINAKFYSRRCHNGMEHLQPHICWWQSAACMYIRDWCRRLPEWHRNKVCIDRSEVVLGEKAPAWSRKDGTHLVWIPVSA